MSGEMERQRRLIERSGLGLLPGLGLAFALCMLAIAALQFELWWVSAVVLAFLFITSGAVVWLVLKVMDDDRDSGRE
jgi:hypothetical protein